MRDSLNFRTQRGKSMWTVMMGVVVAGFILTIAFKLLPAYISNYDVKAVIDSLVSEPRLGNLSTLEVRRLIERKFDINQVDNIKAQCRARDEGKIPCVKITRTRDAMTIDAGYEVRIPVMGNVDAVVKFEGNKIEVPISSG